MCGVVEGKFYYGRLNCSSGNLGTVKCIHFNNEWLSPNEFEVKGSKARYWKRSITHNSKALLSILPLLDVDESSQSSCAGSSHSSCRTFLANPVLAFIKAHHLRGDTGSLKSVLCARFDLSKLSSALKELWDFCRADLERLGILYQACRSVDTVFLDIISAFEKLDLDKSLPDIFCEANDLIILPCLDLDPVSKQLDLNTQAVKAMSRTIYDLPKNHVRPLVDQIASGIDSLTAVISSVKLIKNDLTSSVVAAAKEVHSTHSHQPAHSMAPSFSSKNVARPQPDRSANIIVFGLPESDTLEGTKEGADSLLSFVAGRSVPWADAF